MPCRSLLQQRRWIASRCPGPASEQLLTHVILTQVIPALPWCDVAGASFTPLPALPDLLPAFHCCRRRRRCCCRCLMMAPQRRNRQVRSPAGAAVGAGTVLAGRQAAPPADASRAAAAPPTTAPARCRRPLHNNWTYISGLSGNVNHVRKLLLYLADSGGSSPLPPAPAPGRRRRPLHRCRKPSQEIW